MQQEERFRERSREKESKDANNHTNYGETTKNGNDLNSNSIEGQQAQPLPTKRKEQVYLYQRLTQKTHKIIPIIQLLSRFQTTSTTHQQLSDNLQEYVRAIHLFTQIYTRYPQVYNLQSNFSRDNRELLKSLVQAATSQIKEVLGNIVASGSVVFSLTLQTESFDTIILYQGQQYTINVKKALNDPDPKVNFLPLNWFNILVRNFLKNLKFFEYGRTKKYYDSKDRASVAETRLDVLKGFATSFHLNESGLNLQIDLCYKLVRQDTLLQIIKQVYHDNANYGKDEKRDLVKAELVGCQIIANYGNFRAYVIDDVLFDKDTSTFEVQIQNSAGEDEYITLDNYFQKRYNITIRDKKAPILINKLNRQNKVLYFIPELCIMAGVPKNFNEFMRKKVSQHCAGDPEKRLREIIQLNRRMLKGDSMSINADIIRQEFGIQISDQPLQVNAKNLSPPTILFGQNTFTREIFNGSFNSGKNPVFRPIGKVSFAIIHPIEFSIREFEKTMEEFTLNFGLTFEKDIKSFKLSENRHQHLKEIEDYLLSRIQGRYQMVIIIVDNNLKKSYKQIKQLSLIRTGILSQVICQDTLYKRGIKVICSKVIQQIFSKMGKTVWAVQKPKNLYSHLMLVSAVISSQNIVDFTQFFNQAAPLSKQGKKQSLEIIGKFIFEAFQAYQKLNNCLPKGILYFREGMDDESINELLEIEVPQIEQALLGVSQPKMMIISVQRSQNMKVFFQNNGRVTNPPFGTIIDSEIVSKNYEFYMISQHAPRGSVQPTLYRIVYDKIQMPMEMLEDFIYSQCYNYQNWTGSIKVPAIVQNASRLAKFVGENLGKNASNSLQDTLFYL